MRVVTLSLLKQLENNSFGVIDQNLFWEKLGIGRDGLYITELGNTQSRTAPQSTTYEIFSRNKDDLIAYTQLQEVADFLRTSYETCKLPAVPLYDAEGFDNVTIMPPSTISNNGEDANGHIIYSITGKIYYGDAREHAPIPPPLGIAIITENGLPITTENNLVLIEE